MDVMEVDVVSSSSAGSSALLAAAATQNEHKLASKLKHWFSRFSAARAFSPQSSQELLDALL
jgi:hypothetical protein